MPPQVAAYLSGTFTAGIGFVGSVANCRGCDSVTANAKKARKATTSMRMIEA